VDNCNVHMGRCALMGNVVGSSGEGCCAVQRVVDTEITHERSGVRWRRSVRSRLARTAVFGSVVVGDE